MSVLSCFDFDGAAVRVLTREHEPWFVAADVCRVLALSNVTESCKSLESEELDSVILNSGVQGRKNSIISESGLYALVFKSRKPEAKRFRKWVTSEVLPAIRKVGSYQASEVAISEEREEILERLADAERRMGYALMMAASGRMSPTQAKAVAALGGRQMEAIRLHLDLMSSVPAKTEALPLAIEGGAA